MWDARQPFLKSVTSRNAEYSYPILTKRLFYRILHMSALRFDDAIPYHSIVSRRHPSISY